jgi:arylsulfatase A-like enzyme/Flp pilus assembly protein TadD
VSRGRPRTWPVALAAVLAAVAAAGCGHRQRPWNLLVVTFDTTRADYLGCYGRASARTPHLDRLAAEGFRFANAFTAVPVTLPSHSTIFTGTYPLAHGVRDNGVFQLPEEADTLAEVLHRAGYATGAAIGSFPLTRQFGIAQGFDFFDDHVTITGEDYRGDPLSNRPDLFFDERPAARVNDAILPWLRAQGERPFFAWIHYWDPHHPHIPPPPFNQLYLHDLYQGEIAYADQSLGVVLDDLRGRGLLDRTLVVMAGDHGEGRGEHGEETHSTLAYDSTLHVPLIVRVPGRGGGRVIDQRVGTVDIMPTILDLLGLPVGPQIQGRSLVPLLDGRSLPPRPYYAETLTPRVGFGWGELRVIFDGPYKYIFGPRPELYRLDEDPGEIHDLVAAEPEVAARMKQRLAAMMRRYARPHAAAVHQADDETRRQLAALGYVSASGADPASIVEELRSDGEAPQDRAGDNTLSSAAKQFLLGKDFLFARQVAEQLVERDPDSAFYRRLLAMAYLGLDEAGSAADVIEQAPTLKTPDSATFLDVARRLFAAGERDRGLAIAQRLVAENDSATGHYLLGEMWAQLGDRKRHVAELQRALALDPEYGAARLSLAISLAEAGDVDAAEEHLRRLVAEQPLNARYWYNLGVLLVSAGRSDEALAKLRRAVEIYPAYCRAQLSLLTVAHDRGLDAEAEPAFAHVRTSCHDPDLIKQARAALGHEENAS